MDLKCPLTVDDLGEIRDADGLDLDQLDMEAAEEICRRANAHAALVEACEAMVAWFDAEDQRPPDYDFHKCMAKCKEAEDKARAALKQSKE